ncbi:SIR2 family protein [Trichococcus shcherbakoviae]|uniref:SIR2 family protein n=1 Tax=Trichococcus shcherbakoviae TaxID=2094020 RepID=UPI0029F4CCD1|nr:SIR2 family protein [Trichococcus shcherbakoviae]
MKKYREYIKEIARASKYGKLVFFVGAGLSTLSEYPQWWELVDRYFNELYGKKKEGDFSTDEYLKIPQIFYDVKGEEAYDKILNDIFSVDKNPNPIHFKILAMNPVHIITTNYDNLIDKTCLQRGKYYSHISAEEDVALAPSSRYLLKVHGDFSRGIKGENVVLKESDYMNYDLNSPLISNLMKTIMATHTIVFIGYGVGDYNINLLLNWVKQLQKEGYNKPFFIRTDHEKIEENDVVYYENKGLRIIDSASIKETEKDDYMERYDSVMDLLIETRDNDNLTSDDDVIDYIYQKLSPLFVLKNIRKNDLKYVFEFDYHFEVNGMVVKHKNKGFGYLEHFFEIKEKMPRKLSYETKNKFEKITNFFDANKIICMADNSDNRMIDTSFTIDSPAYNNDYEEMERIVQNNTCNMEADYEKAFYLACLGMWEESYNLYSELLSEATDESNWWIHYLSQINRYRLYQSIIQSKDYFGGIGQFTHRGLYKPFTDDFLNRLESEMKNFDVDEIFQSMPYKFQERYKILEFLSDNQFLYEDTVKLFELTNKIHNEIHKGMYSMGNLTSDIDVQFRLNDNIRFLYENSLWSVNFKEIKQYIRSSIILQFEKAEYDQTRDEDELGFFKGIVRSNFHIDYFDFVSITKSFNIDDVKYIERICKIERFTYSDLDKIENYITRIANNLIKYFSNENNNIVFYHIFIPEAKTAFYFAKYIKLSDKILIKLFRTILFYYPEFDADINTKFLWLSRITQNNGLPKKAIQIIEEFLLVEVEKQRDSKFIEQSSSGALPINFANLIKYYYEDYTSEELSNYALTLTDESKYQIDYIYKLSSILSRDANEHLSSMRTITNLDEIIDSWRVGALEHLTEYEDIILNFIEERLSTIRSDKEKGIQKMYADNHIVTFAIQYFIGELNNSKMKDFVGIDDEYDLFVDPEDFDYKKFKAIWLKNYSEELLEKISKDKNMRPHLIEILKERVKNSKDKRYLDILLKYFM